jgi:Sigma-70 region 2
MRRNVTAVTATFPSPRCLRDRCPSLTGGDRALAEDLAQAAFGAVWRHWSRVSVKEAPEAHAHKVMLNTFLSWRRRRWMSEISTERFVVSPPLGPSGVRGSPASIPVPRHKPGELDDQSVRQLAAGNGGGRDAEKLPAAAVSRWRRRTGIEPASDAARRSLVLKTRGTTRNPDASADDSTEADGSAEAPGRV